MTSDVEFDELELEDSTVAWRESAEIVLYPQADDRNVRLDKFVAANIPDMSRAWLQRVIDDGGVAVDRQVRGRTFKMTPGQVVTVTLPPIVDDELEPEDIPLTLVHEDADIVVIDKPAGMVVHPAPGHRSGTLVNALLFRYPDISMAGSRRPGIVHRLDRDTSGLIAIGRTDVGRNHLLSQWADKTVIKQYLALLRGNPDTDQFVVDAPIGRDPNQRKKMAVVASGKPARSHFEIAERFESACVAEVTIETGRTHQIRVHAAYAGFPVVADSVYNRFTDELGGTTGIAGRHLLHAARLVITNVAGNTLDLESALPGDFASATDRLEGSAPE
jgi:23S rRNA pseudouridine1911/1915/1917 synthase